MFLRVLFFGAVALLTVLQAGCHKHRRCCVPCCPTSCSCYQPVEYTEPSTFAPTAVKPAAYIESASQR